MRGERRLLRLGEFLVRRACRGLPREIRDDRHAEWTAELPAILHDPQIRFAPRRAVRMLAYAADTLRGTGLARNMARRRSPGQAVALGLWILIFLGFTASDVENIVRAPGYGPGYLQLAWNALFLAVPASMLMRSARRVRTLICLCMLPVGIADTLWTAVWTPGQWVEYIYAAVLVLLALAWWLVAKRRAGAKRA